MLLFWAAAVLLAFATGFFFVKFLTVHPLQMSLHLALFCASFFALAQSIARLGPGRILPGLVLGVGGFCVGYLLAARLVLSQEDPRAVPALQRDPNDRGKGHTAVVYFTHGEPETYSPVGWLNQFREFDEQKIAFVPFFARPFFIYKLRRAYLRVGQSHHRKMHTHMARRLEESLLAGGENVKVYLSFLDDDPRPDAALIRALNEGASEVVVAEVFLTISNHTAEGERLIREVGAEAFVPVHYTGPLWDSPTLKQMFLEKAEAALDGTPRSKTGIVLVGHGQPDEWDREFPTETEHEIAFRQEVIDLLAASGYRRENLGLAWMEFKSPKPAEKVKALLANGVEKILYFSAAISADGLHSQYDVPHLMHQAELPAGFPLVNLGAWNDHPRVIQAIQEKVQAALKEPAAPEPAPVKVAA